MTQDIHSFGNPEHARVTHLNLDLDVLFDQHSINGTVILTLEQDHKTKQLVLDTRALQIDETEVSPDGRKFREAAFTKDRPDPILGTALRIDIKPDTRFVRIRYSTSPSAATALQWLTPEQTAGKLHPFLFTQSQAIHARSWIPLQDSPGVRVTYEARVRTPIGLKAVMSATNCPDTEDCHFVMDQPVPPYLIALAVGNLKFRSTGPRTGVWAEPETLDKAATELSDMEAMLEAIEKLYGPYQWHRYDVLIMPPSFPFGGMENPMLTFATPTILAGDKSLVSLIAHELAHSWSGNLVTNAMWSDFWLNEGFTVYIERRILEQIYGQRRAEMEAALGYQELQSELKTHPERDQILHVDLKGRDPDDGATQIPYEKGALFLLSLEQAFGRDNFDSFLKDYFANFAFQSITTEESLAYLREHLFVLDAAIGAKIPVQEWIFSPGLPAGAPKPASEAFAAVDTAAATWLKGQFIETGGWSTQEWLHFLGALPAKLDTRQLVRLDDAFHLTGSTNNEKLALWLLIAARNRYDHAYPRMEQFLTQVGRRKYVKPLYEAMDPRLAESIYEKARDQYHPITQASIDALLAQHQPKAKAH